MTMETAYSNFSEEDDDVRRYNAEMTEQEGSYEPPAVWCISAVLLVSIAVGIAIVLVVMYQERNTATEIITPDSRQSGQNKKSRTRYTPEGNLDWTPTSPVANGTARPYRLPREVQPIGYNLTICIDKDVNATKFTGKVDILIACTTPTSTISLHTHEDMQLNASFSDNIIVLGYKRTKDVVAVTLNKRLRRGKRYSLSLQFENTFLPGGEFGFFTDHQLPDKRITYATIFEPIGARHAFPCFDEPDLKATFDISLLHSQSLRASSNMPIIRSTPVGADMTLDTFEKTPVMSTYLAAWVVSDFKAKTRGRVTVWGSRDVGDEEMERTLNYTIQSLEYCEDFFGIKYDLPKLDIVGISALSVSGMENWGLIIAEGHSLFGLEYFSWPAVVTILHEVIHQWLGNRITNTWWNDIWVQEAPTYYLETRTHILDPDHYSGASLLGNSFGFSDFKYSRPLLFPETSPFINKVNDDLNNAVAFSGHPRAHFLIRMIHFLLGDAEFRAALSAVVRKYDKSNLNGYEFLRTMTEGQTSEPKVDIYGHMLSWFESDGIPELYFYRNYNNQTVTATQGPPGKPSSHLYHIPIVYPDSRRPDMVYPIRYNDIYWMTHVQESFSHQRDNQSALFINPGMIGYFVINYDEYNWALIGQFLTKNPNMMDPGLIRQLLASSFHFYRAGQTTIASHLWIWNCLKNVADMMYWLPSMPYIRAVDGYLAGLDSDGSYGDRLIEIMYQLIQTISFSTSGNSPIVDRQLTVSTVKDLLCVLDRPECVQPVLGFWNNEEPLLNDYTAFRKSLGPLRGLDEVALCVIVRHTNFTTWTRIKSWVNTTAPTGQEPWQVFGLMCSNDDDTLKRSLDFVMANVPGWPPAQAVPRWPMKFRRALLDYFLNLDFAKGVAAAGFGNRTVHLVQDFVENDNDLNKLKQQLQVLYPSGDEASAHIEAATAKLRKKQRDLPHIKRWLMRQLPLL
ncbi:endoplasmic reticulum aminopeptidase 1-like [Ornithodoros turicata]|uniref:endoplasmic reticulum aminopeptidase 1-like n=1 Tax=Ornithodoros turicata TaxID=34597 RepID=UPI003138F78D